MTKIYGLVGHPLGHSFSQKFFTAKFEREGIDARYENYDVPDVKDLRQLIANNPELCGLNVTAPYKHDVIVCLDDVDPAAHAVDAVNVIAINRTGGKLRLTGYNTDIIGFREAVAPITRGINKALVLGTGGASRAVCAALQQLDIEAIRVSRSEHPDAITYLDVDSNVLDHHRLIVNATPLGTWPNTQAAPPIDYNLLTSGHVCVDVVYNPAITWFMQLAAARGCAVKNGLDMLHGQARAAWRIWNGDFSGSDT